MRAQFLLTLEQLAMNRAFALQADTHGARHLSIALQQTRQLPAGSNTHRVQIVAIR